MAFKYSSFAGWEKNLKLFNDSVEVIITLEVGPRIISYRPVQGHSVFKLIHGEAGKSKEDFVKDVDLPAYKDFNGYKDRFKANAASAYDEVAAR